jgi:hypothetical protein
VPLRPDERAADVTALLQRLHDELAERWVDDVLFDPRDAIFAQYHNTAWTDLERELLVARRAPFGWTGFLLTPRGWLVSIMGDEFSPAPDWAKDRIYCLVKALKAHCDRTAIDHGRLSLAALSAETNVPAGWIRNAIVSRMMYYVVSDKEIDARCQDEEVVIGAGFGQPKVAR